MESTKGKKKQTRNLKTSLIVFGIVLLLVLGVYFYFKNIMPEQMFNQGKKYLDVGQYDKALRMFDMVSDARSYDSEPVYYQALALSKLAPTYENQKKLYEIAQLEDCDEASALAEKILLNMRKQLEQQVGPNYADNILFDDILIRWNLSHPVTYSILADTSVPDEYIGIVKDAFEKWQTATNGEIKFREVHGKGANIVVNFVDDISMKDAYEANRVGKTLPAMKDDTLQKMDIYIRKFDTKGNQYNSDKLSNLAMHEIGHAIGLGGHSADSNDIMFYTGDYIDDKTVKKDISTRDLNTFRLLYKMIPDVIDVPINPSEYNNLFYHEIITTYPGENFELEIKRLLSELENDRQNIIVMVDLAINYAYKKYYARSNDILYHVLPLVETDLQNQHVILYNLAVNFYKMRNYDSAAKYLALAENIKSDMDTQILDTFIDVRKGRIDLALTKLKILIEKYPENIDIALKLAEVYHIKKERKLENEVISNLIKRNPKAARDRRVLKYNAKNKKVRNSAVIKK